MSKFLQSEKVNPDGYLNAQGGRTRNEFIHGGSAHSWVNWWNDVEHVKTGLDTKLMSFAKDQDTGYSDQHAYALASISVTGKQVDGYYKANGFRTCQY